MGKTRKILGALALSSTLAFAGAGAATAAPTLVETSTSIATADGVNQPQVAYVWNVWQDNFYTEETCVAASFGILWNHPYIRDYRCIKNTLGGINPGRWSLWVYVPDAEYPPT